MYKKVNMNLRKNSGIIAIECQEGETIEQKVNRIVNNKEPIKDGAPIVYTERKDGVKPEYDIRTDRWEIALTAMDNVNRARTAQRENRPEAKIVDINKKDGGAEPIQATEGQP